jgi:predicted Ser/Thr protein kinase
MPASYADILFGRLALTNNLVGGDQLRECLNAQEAGKRAGVEQTLAQVLVKRGYLTRGQLREVEIAREAAERGRRAKVAIQLLLRHGRTEAELQGLYTELKAQQFPVELSAALEQQGVLRGPERATLDAAVERAMGQLHQREAEELARLVEQRQGMRPPPAPQPSPAPPQPAPVPPAPPAAGAFPGTATAHRAAYQATAQVPVYPGLAGPTAAPPPPPARSPAAWGAAPAAYAPYGQPAPYAPGYGSPSGFAPPANGPYGAPPAGWGAPPQAPPGWGGPPPGYVATETPAAPPPRPRTGERAAYAPPAPAYRPGQAFQQSRGAMPAWPAQEATIPAALPGDGRAPVPSMPVAVVAAPGTLVAAPASAQPRAEAQRGLPPVRPVSGLSSGPIDVQRPAAYGKTAERAAADLARLPEWAKTGFRKIDPSALDAAPAAAAPDPRLRLEAMAEPSGNVPGFEIKERIGKGTVGVVYRAVELQTGRMVALKVLLPIFRKNQTLIERFRREAKLAASLDHPNVRKIYSGGEIGGQLFLAMEYIDGETLQDKIDKHSTLPENESLRWIAQIARAMDHYVKIGMLHRDVKPANVLVSKDNRALLCDLGISKRVYEDYALTMQGTTLGSPWYLSPEQGMGTDDLDIRSDVYSLGVTLFHCLTGRVPFLGGNAGVIISKHAKEPVPDVRRINSKISRGAAALIERMMAKRREDRHQTPKELLAEIAWLRSESGIAATPIVPLDPPSLDEAAAIVRTRPGFWRRLARAVGLA